MEHQKWWCQEAEVEAFLALKWQRMICGVNPFWNSLSCQGSFLLRVPAGVGLSLRLAVTQAAPA